jgi:hypothetical protein
MFDFKSVESAKESSFIVPGVHTVNITKVSAGEFPQKKSPYLGVTFTTDEGLSIEEKFPLSEKAMGRLQYLHEAWTGKKINKAFKSADEVATYFASTFVNPKAGTRNLLVGGEINGKVVYGQLPYTGFIVGDDSNLELGAFTEGDDNWNKYVKKSTRTSESSGKGNGILNDKDEDKLKSKTSTKKDEKDDDEDSPW